ncbi:MAG: DUF1501 domain-containing protein [Pirellulaceae bacterium]
MNQFNRRQLLQAASLGLLGVSASGWFPAFAEEVESKSKKRRHCVLLWMTGGPTQTDTFDMKPGHANGGEFKEKETKVAGLRFSEHLPKLAAMSDQLAVIRSLSTKEGDHGRGTYLMRTGHQPQGPVQYPSIASSLSKALGDENDAVPQNVSISPYRAFNQSAFGPGFLGPKYGPLTVGATDSFQPNQPGAATAGYAELKVDDLTPPAGVAKEQFEGRLELWRAMQSRFLASHRTASPIAQDTVYQRAVRLMHSGASKAFDLSEEPDKVREAYGKGRFGQGCLMARRLIEQGVSFVEVTLGSATGGSFGWDTHQQNFTAVKALSAELDTGWGTLMQELADRGLLESTTFLWMGEFGRTPMINPQGGRDHFPAAWSCVLGGGGIKGGQAYGKTNDAGTEVTEGKVDVGDVLATLSTALGVAPDSENVSEVGRPIKIAEGRVIKELVR